MNFELCQGFYCSIEGNQIHASVLSTLSYCTKYRRECAGVQSSDGWNFVRNSRSSENPAVPLSFPGNRARQPIYTHKHKQYNHSTSAQNLAL